MRTIFSKKCIDHKTFGARFCEALRNMCFSQFSEVLFTVESYIVRWFHGKISKKNRGGKEWKLSHCDFATYFSWNRFDVWWVRCDFREIKLFIGRLTFFRQIIARDLFFVKTILSFCVELRNQYLFRETDVFNH